MSIIVSLRIPRDARDARERGIIFFSHHFIVTCFFQQRDCIQFALTAKPAQRYMPTDVKSLQYKIWKLVMSKPFDTFILVLIALNTGVLMTQVGVLINQANVLSKVELYSINHLRWPFVYLPVFCHFPIPIFNHRVLGKTTNVKEPDTQCNVSRNG